MNDQTPATHYVSPLRERQAAETRRQILQAVASLLTEQPDSALSFDAIAGRAGVERRTVFRHFTNKEGLLDAFWQWINERAGVQRMPASERDFSDLPPVTFAGFDRLEGVIRASLSSAAGRELRLRQAPARRVAIEKATADALAGLPRRRALQIRAVVQLLYSAAAWQSMKDYWGLSGDEAGIASARAIEAILAAARREGHSPQTRKSKTKGNGK
jgi:AcrR family transcriptional regulator